MGKYLDKISRVKLQTIDIDTSVDLCDSPTADQTIKLPKITLNEEPNVVNSITISDGKVKYHDDLLNLDYEHSGHTGFASSNDLEEVKEELNASINKKQDIIEFINLSAIEGIIDEEQLALLTNNKVNRLVYNNIIYYLGVVSVNHRKYFSRVASSELNEVDIDMETGEYLIKSKLDPIVEEHINNTHIHITDTERTFWNNKVTAYMSEEDNENLILTKL